MQYYICTGNVNDEIVHLVDIKTHKGICINKEKLKEMIDNNDLIVENVKVKRYSRGKSLRIFIVDYDKVMYDAAFKIRRKHKFVNSLMINRLGNINKILDVIDKEVIFDLDNVDSSIKSVMKLFHSIDNVETNVCYSVSNLGVSVYEWKFKRSDKNFKIIYYTDRTLVLLDASNNKVLHKCNALRVTNILDTLAYAE